MDYGIDVKNLAGLLSTLFLMAGYAPYLLALWRKSAKPHAFSWFSWGVINAIVCAVQVSQDAGPGAWTSGIAALFNIGIAAHAVRFGEKHITRADWVIFISVLASLPLWALTKDPVWSVVMLSVIDTAAFLPTLRKSWHRPHEEVATTFALGIVGYGLALFATKDYGFASICFPLKVMVANGIFVACLLYRRKVLQKAATHGDALPACS